MGFAVRKWAYFDDILDRLLLEPQLKSVLSGLEPVLEIFRNTLGHVIFPDDFELTPQQEERLIDLVMLEYRTPCVRLLFGANVPFGSSIIEGAYRKLYAAYDLPPSLKYLKHAIQYLAEVREFLSREKAASKEETALFLGGAVYIGRVDILKQLVVRGICSQISNADFSRSLCRAVDEQHVEMIEILLEACQSIKQLDYPSTLYLPRNAYNGETALELARRMTKGTLEVRARIIILISAKRAQLSAQDDPLTSRLYFDLFVACRGKNTLLVARALRSKGLLPKLEYCTSDGKYWSAEEKAVDNVDNFLYQACAEALKATFPICLELVIAGADFSILLDKLQPEGFLYQYLKYFFEARPAHFLSDSMDVRRCIAYDISLSFFVKFNFKLKELIAHAAFIVRERISGVALDFNFLDARGQTVLMIAAAAGQKGSVDELLFYDVDPSIEGGGGITALEVAVQEAGRVEQDVQERYIKVVELLLSVYTFASFKRLNQQRLFGYLGTDAGSMRIRTLLENEIVRWSNNIESKKEGVNKLLRSSIGDDTVDEEVTLIDAEPQQSQIASVFSQMRIWDRDKSVASSNDST